MTVPSLRGSTGIEPYVIDNLAAAEADILGPSSSNQSQVFLYQRASLSYYVAQSLEQFDREFRRTVSSSRSGSIPLRASLTQSQVGQVSVPRQEQGGELTGRRADRRGLRPAPPQSGLRLVAAEEGSSLLGLVPWGEAVHLLNQAPLSAILNAAALWSAVLKVRIFFNRDPLRGVTARQAIDVLREFHGLPDGALGPPDQEIKLSVDLPDGTQVRGAREVSLRIIEDGSKRETWVHIVGDLPHGG